MLEAFLLWKAILFLFSGQAPFKFERGTPKPVINLVLRDTKELLGFQGHRGYALHQEVFGSRNVSGKAYGNFLKAYVHKLRYSDSLGAFAENSGRDPGLITLGRGYSESRPMILRISFLLHEARHTNEAHDFWDHVPCPIPFRDPLGNDRRSSLGLLEGEPACDNTAIGAYGVQVIFAKAIADSCENCNELVRAQASLVAQDYAHRITAIDAQERLVHELGISRRSF